jgi:hypothetical protein
MWNDADAVIRPELAQDEKLLWSGRPGTGFRFLSGDWYVVPFSLMWTGFVVTAFISVLRLNRPDPSWFILIPFLLIGFFLLFGRYIFDSLVRGRTYYGLSDERAIIVRHWFGIKVQSLSLRTLPEITLSVRDDRGGTIFLGSATPWAAWYGMNVFHSAHTLTAPSFDAIDDARAVYDLVRQAQRAAQRPGTAL